MIARDLGKTHTELLHGTSAHELMRWKVLYELEAEERENHK